MLKRWISLVLSILLVVSAVPVQTAAQTDGESGRVYTISNRYLSYSINTQTGGFAITTAEGHPDKRYDNDLPLLYQAAEGCAETSFVTVRIDGKDYIFGRDYGLFGLRTSLSTPVISNEGRLLELTWTLDDYAVTQRVALSADEDNALTGNVGVSYAVTNRSGKAADVGVRILFDASLGNDVDAPYVTADADVRPVMTEKRFSGDGMPNQLRAVDSLSNAVKASYLFFDGWNVAYSADSVIVGHWANLADTRYAYTPDPYCSFNDYSNVYRVPDTAYAVYWDEKPLAVGETRYAELLYGVGNFTGGMVGKGVGLDMTTERVRLNSAGDGYVNDGEITVGVDLDNSVDNAVALATANVKLTVGEGLTVVGDDNVTYRDVAVGDIYHMEFTVRAENQVQITSAEVFAVLSGMDADGGVISETAARYVLLPGLKNAPNIQFNAVSPQTVYTLGEKYVTVSGQMAPLSALHGTDGWDLYLDQAATGDSMRIPKKDVVFADDYTAFTFRIGEELAVGKYEIRFAFSDPALVASYGVTGMKATAVLEASADDKYAVRSYGVAALVRHDRTKYDFLVFDNERDYTQFFEGKKTVGGIRHDFTASYANGGDVDDYEVLLTVRGRITETEKDGRTGYLAEAQNGSVTVNNMLAYTGEKPLTLEEKDGSYIVSGDGELKVINSITVWKSKWSFRAAKDVPYTLNPDATDLPGTKQLTLSLDGAAFLIQSIGGFLIDLDYGLMTADDEDGVIVHGISFGGKISIPIKDPSGKKDSPETAGDGGDDYGEDLTSMFAENDSDKYTTAAATNHSDFKKDTNFSDGNLSAEVDSVLFGEKTEKVDGYTKVTSTGFIGIDATLSLGLPSDILGNFISNAPGVYASVTINTIDNFYQLSAGLKIKIIECEGTLAFKQTNVKGRDVVVPDRIEFYIRDGLKIPLAPPLFMTGLGGGITNLADSIGGEFDTLPPVTLLLFARLELIETMIGDFNASVSLSGIDLTGDLRLKEDKKGKVIDLQLGISARWIDPWHLSAYGKISVIDGLLQGTVSLIIADDLFYGYAAIAICIPNSVPVIGGKELAGIEAAICNKYIAANVKIIGIKFGVIYYWTGEFDYGTGINVQAALFSDEFTNDNGENCTAMYGTNLHKLSARRTVADSAAALLDADTSAVSMTFDPSEEDALLFEIPFTGTVLPKAADLVLTDPDGLPVALTDDDGIGGGNVLAQSRNDGDYLYISVTDPAKLKSGVWTVTLHSEYGRIGDFGVYGADAMPELTGVAVASHASESDREVTVTYTTTGAFDEKAVLDLYVTDDPDALTAAKTSGIGEKDAFGVNVAHVRPDASGRCVFTLPDSFGSGTYYVVGMISSEKYGISAVMSDTSFTFVNPALPHPVKSATVYYAGNNALCVRIEDAEIVDYTHYLVNIVNADGSTVENGFSQVAVGADVIVGKGAALEKGKAYRVEVMTLREEGDRFYYGEETVVSADYTLPDEPLPVLLAVETDVVGDKHTSRQVHVTYTFDRPVLLRMRVNGVDTPAGENTFKTVWSYTGDFEDGDVLLDFVAYNTAKDHVSGADFPSVSDAISGFTVDTSAPVLSLTQDALLAESGDTVLFGTNVVSASADGSYTVSGLTEKDAVLTVNGSTDGVTLSGDSTFTVEGGLSDGESRRELRLCATDAAGNASYLTVTVVAASFTFTGLRLYAGGTLLTENDEGDKTVALARGESVDLAVCAVASDGSEYPVDAQSVTWTILGEKNVITLADGRMTAVRGGSTALKASVGGVSFGNEAALLAGGTEDVVLISVEADEAETAMTLVSPFDGLMTLTHRAVGSGVTLKAVLKDGVDGTLPALVAYTAVYDASGRLLAVTRTVFGADHTAYLAPPAGSRYKIFIWTDACVPVTDAITPQSPPQDKLF